MLNDDCINGGDGGLDEQYPTQLKTFLRSDSYAKKNEHTGNSRHIGFCK